MIARNSGRRGSSILEPSLEMWEEEEEVMIALVKERHITDFAYRCNDLDLIRLYVIIEAILTLRFRVHRREFLVSF